MAMKPGTVLPALEALSHLIFITQVFLSLFYRRGAGGLES